MTTLSDIVSATLQEDLKELSFRFLREWVCCDSFRVRVPVEEVLEATWLGRAINEIKEREGWQWYKSQEGRQIKHLKERVLDYWVEHRWVRLERPRLGRRRVVEYNSKTVRKAMAIWNSGCQGFVSDSTWAWAGSVLGENSNRNKLFVVTLSDSVFEETYHKVEIEDLEGLTREELADALDLPKRVANHFVRYLVKTHKWSVRETSKQGVKCRVLRYCQTKDFLQHTKGANDETT